MKKRGFIPPRSIKFIESTGGQLRKDTAKYLSEFFECSVDDMYGCIEMYGIARSKGMSELKVLEDNVYLEIVDENGKRVPDAEGDRGSYCAKDVLKFCRDNLEDYKIPHRIIVVDALERTKTGKIQRKGV